MTRPFILSLILFAPPLLGQTIGLGFWIDANLGKTAERKQIVEKQLAGQVSELNRYFTNSQVGLQAEIVTIRYVDIRQTDAVAILDDMFSARGEFAELFTVADEYGADFNFAFVDKLRLRGKPNCGRAYAVNKTRDQIATLKRAIAVINSACTAQTLAHELGHLFGLNHGHLIDRCIPNKGHTTAIAPYALGYAEGNCDGRPQAGEFGTIMVGGYMKNVNGDGHSALPLFSNPRIRNSRCGEQGICDDPESADAARVLNENAEIYRSHAEPDVHVLIYQSAALSHCIASRYRFTEISDMYALACPNAAVHSLAGLQQLSNLRRIDLSGNPLVDVDALFDFPIEQIERIDLTNTPLSPELSDKLYAHFGNKIILP